MNSFSDNDDLPGYPVWCDISKLGWQIIVSEFNFQQVLIFLTLY